MGSAVYLSSLEGLVPLAAFRIVLVVVVVLVIGGDPHR